MSTQALQSTLVELLRSEEALALYQHDPEALAARYGLSDEERDRPRPDLRPTALLDVEHPVGDLGEVRQQDGRVHGECPVQ